MREVDWHREPARFDRRRAWARQRRLPSRNRCRSTVGPNFFSLRPAWLHWREAACRVAWCGAAPRSAPFSWWPTQLN